MATLSQNVTQAISDLNSIKNAIENKGVVVPSGTPTSQYAGMIGNISQSDTQLRELIQGSAASFEIPHGVTILKKYIFYGMQNLTSVTIPNSVTIIDENAFNNCPHLESLTIPNSVLYLNSYAITNCSRFRTLYIPNSIISFGYMAINVSSLENVTIENGFNGFNLNLSSSTRYSADTIVGWQNALADRTGDTAQTLIIGTTNINKLTAEQIAIATNKNWNLA